MDRKATTWMKRSFVLFLIASLYEVLINGMGYWIALSIITPELVGGTRRASKQDEEGFEDGVFSIQTATPTVWNSNLFNDQTGDISMMHNSPTSSYATYSIISTSTVVDNQSSDQQENETENENRHGHDLHANSDGEYMEDDCVDDENTVDQDEELEQLNVNALLNFESLNADDVEDDLDNGDGPSDEPDINRSYSVATRTHSTVEHMGDGVQGVSGLMFSISWGTESDSDDDDSLMRTPDTEEYDLTIETRSFVRHSNGRAILSSRTGIYGLRTNDDGERSNLLLSTPTFIFSQPMDLITTERLEYSLSLAYSMVVQIMIMATFLHFINRS